MQNFKNRIYKQHGFTLVELMVVVAIFFFILAGVFSAYITQHHASVIQERVSDAQQNGRVAMDFLSKEIRMAGFAMPSIEVNGYATPITPEINNDASDTNKVLEGTDQITIVTGYRQISTLANDISAGATSISLTGNGTKFDDEEKKYVCIDATTQADNYVVSSSASGSLSITTSLTRDYKAGAPVFLVKAITYSVNKDGVLTRDENTGGGAQTIAPNIEDLQFAYQLTDNTWSNDPPDPTLIRAVRINVLARTRMEDIKPGEAGGGGTISTRPDIEDHDVNNVSKDGFRRRLLTSVVEARNLGL